MSGQGEVQCSALNSVCSDTVPSAPCQKTRRMMRCSARESLFQHQGFHSTLIVFMLFLLNCFLISFQMIAKALWNTAVSAFVVHALLPHRFTFIKNIPNQSQQSRAASTLRDIPPKTRSTPAATMVLDLVSVSNTQSFTGTCLFMCKIFRVNIVLIV